MRRPALTGLSSDQYLGPLTSFSSLRYLYVDQNLLSSEASLPDCVEELILRLREPLRMDFLSHLARASHKLLSLKSVFFSIDDDCRMSEIVVLSIYRVILISRPLGLLHLGASLNWLP
jgi:hypothetical protein